MTNRIPTIVNIQSDIGENAEIAWGYSRVRVSDSAASSYICHVKRLQRVWGQNMRNEWINSMEAGNTHTHTHTYFVQLKYKLGWECRHKYTLKSNLCAPKIKCAMLNSIWPQGVFTLRYSELKSHHENSICMIRRVFQHWLSHFVRSCHS